MAVIVRYFSTAAAGAGDGTTWADRAALFSGGAWSTVITGFTFSGGNGLHCLVGPGNYAITASLASGLFAAAPSVANNLFFEGCDSSGVALTPPDPDWHSCQPEWDASGLPSLNTTTNIATSTLANCHWRLIKFTASGRQGGMISAGNTINWCAAEDMTNNATTYFCNGVAWVANTWVRMMGTSYICGVRITNDEAVVNTRVRGNLSATSGDRNGFENTATADAAVFDRVTAVDHLGWGIDSGNGSTAVRLNAHRSVFANCAIGIRLAPDLSQTQVNHITGCMITGCSGYGIETNSQARLFMADNRLRDNAGGNFNTLLNYPTTFNNYTTDSDDATEYVDAASGDYRIKKTAAIWGKGYGVADEPASGSSEHSSLFC